MIPRRHGKNKVFFCLWSFLVVKAAFVPFSAIGGKSSKRRCRPKALRRFANALSRIPPRHSQNTSTIRSIVPAAPFVQCAEYKVTGLSSRDSGRNGLQIAHLTDENNVGSCRRAARRPLAKLSVSAPISRWLIIERMRVYILLDRVFERDDMACRGAVDVVDQCRQCGIFCRSRWDRSR